MLSCYESCSDRLRPRVHKYTFCQRALIDCVNSLSLIELCLIWFDMSDIVFTVYSATMDIISNFVLPCFYLLYYVHFFTHDL